MSIYIVSRGSFEEECKPFIIFSDLIHCVNFLKLVTNNGNAANDIFVNYTDKVKYKITEIPNIIVDPVDHTQVFNNNVRGYLHNIYGQTLEPGYLEALLILEHNNIPIDPYRTIEGVGGPMTPPPAYRANVVNTSSRSPPRPEVVRVDTDRQRSPRTPRTPGRQDDVYQNLIEGDSPSLPRSILRNPF